MYVRNEEIGMPKVSVVIPVYNTEKYLCQCLNSVMNQTLADIEIICINDGSTDSCPRILDEYSRKDSRIKVIHKRNEGLVAARKAGAIAATAPFVGYVDSDDWIEPDMYEQLFHIAKEFQVDLIASGYYLEGSYTTLHYDTVPEGLYGNDRMRYLHNHLIYNLDQKETGLRGSLCCKLFSAEQLKKVQLKIPDAISIAEDKMCLLTYVLDCNSVYVLREAYYHYRINTNSMAHAPNTNYLLCVNEVYKYLIQLYQHKKFTGFMRRQAEIYIVELLVMGINSRLGFENSNIMWVDPYWLEQIPLKSRIVLYGGGELGKKYKRHLMSRTDINYIACIDFSYNRFLKNGLSDQQRSEFDLKVASPEVLKHLDYDYIVITIKNAKKAQQIKNQLVEYGVDRECIFWFEQREIFWKYVAADGLIEDCGEEREGQ